jgi:hypothetical protein
MSQTEVQQRIENTVTNGMGYITDWDKVFENHSNKPIDGIQLQKHLARLEGYDVRGKDAQRELEQIGDIQGSAFIPFNFKSVFSDRQIAFGNMPNDYAKLPMAMYQGTMVAAALGLYQIIDSLMK